MKSNVVVVVLLFLFLTTSSYGFYCYNGCDTGDRLLTTTGISSFPTIILSNKITGSTKKSKDSKNIDKIESFLDDNLNNVAIDIARGHGESLKALAELMKISIADENCFFISLKMNFDEIFPSANVSKEYVAKEIYKHRWKYSYNKTFEKNCVRNRRVLFLKEICSSKNNRNLNDRYLSESIKYNYFEGVKCFLDAGHKINNTISENNHLFLAYTNNNLNIFRYLLKKGAEPEIIVQKKLLNDSIRKGKKDFIEIFLKYGVDINEKDKDGFSLIHSAVYSDNLKIVELLIKRGADVNVKDSLGITPLHIAATFHHSRIMKILIKAEADVNVKDNYNNTPLHMAVAIYKGTIANILIEYGANINTMDSFGNSPLHVAASLDRYGIMELLLIKGADINAKNMSGDTALHIASAEGNLKCVKILVNKKAVINELNNNRKTPLLKACTKLNEGTIWYLVNRKADVNVRTKDNNSVIHEIIRTEYNWHYNIYGNRRPPRRWAIVEFLMKNGAEFNSRNNEGNTPLMISDYRKLRNISETLRKAGAESKPFDLKKPVLKKNVKIKPVLTDIIEIDNKTFPKIFKNKIGQKFVYIKPGKFTMGRERPEKYPYNKKYGKKHKVTLTKGFFLQTTEVTKGQWFTVMKTHPWTYRISKYKQKNAAVRISWFDAKAFIKRLNILEGTAKYRLPTEAEWEYAARAGSDLKKVTTNSTIHDVAMQKPNNWGLFDMFNNANEWCEDWYSNYPSIDVVVPRGPFTAKTKVIRGIKSRGSKGPYTYCFNANPFKPGNNTGFRIVRSE